MHGAAERYINGAPDRSCVLLLVHPLLSQRLGLETLHVQFIEYAATV